MADPLTTLRSEWAVINDAPWSFLLITALVAAAVWRIAKWHYAGQIDTLTLQKGTLEHRLQARDDELKTLTAKLAEALATPRKAQPVDPDEIEQSDRIVGKLHGPEIQRGDGLVLAASLTATGNYNPERPFAFRDMKLKLVRWDREAESRIAGEIRKQFAPAVC